MTTAKYEKGKLYELSIIDLKPDPNQPRKSMDPQALEELTASVKRVGIIQPLLFRVEIGEIGGHDAASCPLFLSSSSPASAASGPPNLPASRPSPGSAWRATPPKSPSSRDHFGDRFQICPQNDLSIEEAEALQRLKEEQKYTDEQLSGVIGKARSTITEIMTLNKLPQKIRDECRGDRQISRATLLEIARKKQARSMLKAYAACKAKQQKGKTTRTKTDPNASQPVFDLCDKAATKINTIDTSAWTEEEKANLQISLNSLKSTIETFLATPAPEAPVAQAPAKKASKKLA